MKGKILFVTGAAIGYVLGARAGRKRYEQIVAAANKVWETPGVQKQVHQVQDFAAEKIGDIPDALVEGAKKAVSSVVKRSNATNATNATNAIKSSAQSANASQASTTGSTVAKKPTAKSTTQKPASKNSTASKSASTRSSTTKSASTTADENE